MISILFGTAEQRAYVSAGPYLVDLTMFEIMPPRPVEFIDVSFVIRPADRIAQAADD